MNSANPLTDYAKKANTPLEVLAVYIVPTLQILLVISSFACCSLHYLGNYFNFYRTTRILFCGRGVVHRSLLYTLMTPDKFHHLEEVLSSHTHQTYSWHPNRNKTVNRQKRGRRCSIAHGLQVGLLELR